MCPEVVFFGGGLGEGCGLEIGDEEVIPQFGTLCVLHCINKSFNFQNVETKKKESYRCKLLGNLSRIFI